MRSLSKINNFALLALLFIIHMISTPCAAEPHHTICSNNTKTYTRNSPYGKNLRNLLNSLSVNTYLEEGFYNTSFGTDDDQVYGQALCRGDVAADVCKSCVSNASEEIMKQCPGAREAFLWYEKCQIQYSYSMSLNEAYTGKYPDSNDYEKNVSNPDSFHKDLKDLMNNLSNKAAYGHSKFMFATGKSNSVSKIETTYGLVQCTRDISPKSCKSCLDYAWGDLDGCCGHRQGGTLFSRSCNMRFELYKFYEESSANGK